MPCPMPLPGIANRLEPFFLSIRMWLFFFEYGYNRHWWSVRAGVRENTCVPALGWGFPSSLGALPERQKLSFVFWLLLFQSAEVRVPGAPASGHHSSHQGPAFLYKLGFLIKSTHCKGPLGLGFTYGNGNN